MNIRTLGFRGMVIGFLLGLAACQTTGGPSPAAITKLQAAGYQPSTILKDVALKDARITGVYLCPEEKCGSLGIVLTGSLISPPSVLGITAEEQIRRRLFVDATLEKLLRNVVVDQGKKEGLQISVRNIRQFSDAQKAGFSLSINMRDKSGMSLKIVANAIVVGNTASVVMSLSTREAQARRGLALALN